MRGVGLTFSRLPAVRAFFAGAAILAGTSGPAAFAQGNGGSDQTAMAIPRIGAPGRTYEGGPASGGYAALPRPLSPSDAARVRRIFADQAAGRMAAAASLTAELERPLLLGTILADRYLGPYHRSTVPELEAWLASYPAQPDAPAIRALLARRLPPGAIRPAVLFEAPPAALAPAPLTDPVPGRDRPRGQSPSGATRAGPEVNARLGRGDFDTALRLIAHTPGLSPVYAILLRAEVAQILFTPNRDAEALRVAVAACAAATPTHRLARAAYVAGLAAWRLGRGAKPRASFSSAAARAPVAPTAQRAAGAFWAARAQ